MADFNRRSFLKKGGIALSTMPLLGAKAQRSPEGKTQTASREGKPAYAGEHWQTTRKNALNIVLIIIDTLRYDYIGADGNTWIRTPNIDRLAGKSWVFDRTFTNSYPTIPMRTDVITGQYGIPFNPWLPLRFDVTTLPQVLAKAGYCTQLIHDTPHLVNGGHAFDWPFHAWTPVRGAEVDRPRIDDEPFTYLENWAPDPAFDFLGDPQLGHFNKYTMFTYSRANRKRKRPQDWNVAELFLTASDFLRDNAKRDNFFLWIDSFDPHEPWDAPPEYVRMYDKTPGYDGRIDPRAFWGGNAHEVFKDKPKVQERIKALYAAKLTHMDRWLGEFLDTLEETGLDKNTAIILTADHGTVAGEHGEFGKRGFNFGGMGEPEGHIPMIVHVPGLGTGRSNMFVQPQDVFATVLGIAGIEKPQEIDGFDVLGLAQRGAETPREVAIMGGGGDARSWRNKKDGHTFTVFARDWILKFSPKQDACRLYRYGSDEDDFASSEPSAVTELRKAGINELARQSLSPELCAWLGREGRKPFPETCYAWRDRPANWDQYWKRTYRQW